MFTVVIFRNCKKWDRGGMESMHFQLASCRGGTWQSAIKRNVNPARRGGEERKGEAIWYAKNFLSIWQLVCRSQPVWRIQGVSAATTPIMAHAQIAMWHSPEKVSGILHAFCQSNCSDIYWNEDRGEEESAKCTTRGRGEWAEGKFYQKLVSRNEAWTFGRLCR